MLQRTAALGAELGQLGLGGAHVRAGHAGGMGHRDHGGGGRHGGGAAAVVGDLDDLLDGLGDGVGAGGHRHPRLAQAGGAADALELGDDLLGVHARADGHAHQTGGGFALAGAAAGPAGVGEHLADAGLIVVDGDIQVAAADLHLLGEAAGHRRTGPGQDGAVGVHSGGGGSLLLAVVDLADVEHLLAAAAVPVDGGALASQLVGQAVDLGHILLCGGVGEVHRLAHGVVGKGLEGGLHLHVPNGGDVVGADEDPL